MKRSEVKELAPESAYWFWDSDKGVWYMCDNPNEVGLLEQILIELRMLNNERRRPEKA